MKTALILGKSTGILPDGSIRYEVTAHVIQRSVAFTLCPKAHKAIAFRPRGQRVRDNLHTHT